jgi:hypothetical protein
MSYLTGRFHVTILLNLNLPKLGTLPAEAISSFCEGVCCGPRAGPRTRDRVRKLAKDSHRIFTLFQLSTRIYAAAIV